MQQAGEGTVGIGIPGALSRATGLVKNAKCTWLIGQPLKQDLKKALHREVRIENDANCFAAGAMPGTPAAQITVFALSRSDPMVTPSASTPVTLFPSHR